MQDAPRAPVICGDDSRAYPPTAPHRPVFLAVRSLAVLLGLLEIVLAVVSQRSINRVQWLSPMLSPAINVCWPAGLDILFILRYNRRSHALTRLLYDGAIGIGFTIASGFLVHFTLGDLMRTDPTSTPATAAVGGMILFCMFSSA